MRVRSLRTREAQDLYAHMIATNEWVYCGRRHAGHGLKASPLANPFAMKGVADRSRVIAAFRAWVWKRLQQNDPTLTAALQWLRPDDTLVCWCLDADDAEAGEEVCHCQVIAKAWWFVRQQ